MIYIQITFNNESVAVYIRKHVAVVSNYMKLRENLFSYTPTRLWLVKPVRIRQILL